MQSKLIRTKVGVGDASHVASKVINTNFDKKRKKTPTQDNPNVNIVSKLTAELIKQNKKS